jgi:hypothetical protein
VNRKRRSTLANAEPPQTFAELIGWLLDNGTRPDGRLDAVGRRWSNQEFGDARVAAGRIDADDTISAEWSIRSGGRE